MLMIIVNQFDIHLLDSCQPTNIDSDTTYENIYENNVKM